MSSYTNAWKNITFDPESTMLPSSTEEVVDIVKFAKKWNKKLKPVGGGHGFNNNVKTNGLLIDLRKMNRILSIDNSTGIVEMEAGITLAEIIEQLEKEGLHFPALGSWSSQSIAGAIGTSTHSSTLKVQSLSDIVLEVEAVLANGDVVCFGGDSTEIKAFRSSLGQLGIITKVKAQFVPSFFLKCDITSMPADEGFKTVLKTARENEFVNMMWFPYIDETATRILTRTDANQANEKAVAQADSAYRSTRFDNTVKDVKDFLDGHEFLGQPAALAEPYSLKFKDAFYADDKVVDESYNVFRYDKFGEPNTNHYLRMILNSETAIDVDQLEPALCRLKTLINEYAEKGTYLNWPRLHVRFTAKSDKTLIGLNADRDTAYVGFYIIGTIKHQPQIELCKEIEHVLIEAGGRPHWGKFRYKTDDDQYKNTYTGYKQFAQLREELDPEGMFSDGVDLFQGLDYFESPPLASMLESLFSHGTYFPVQLL